MKLTSRCALLLPVLLLAACAPSATTGSNQKSTVNTSARNPLTPGDVYTLKGTDQNGAKFEGKLKISNQATEYDEAQQRYYVDADKGYMVVEGGNIVQAWLELSGATEVVCVPYQNERATFPLRGTALRGTDSQINELIRRYNGTDSSYYGSSACNITKG